MNLRLQWVEDHPPHYLGLMVECNKCGILKYGAETPEFCGCQKFQLPPQYNAWWRNARSKMERGEKSLETKYLELLSRASVHEKNSRSFNSCHAFSMLHLANDDKTACFNQPKDKAYPTMLSICGRVYHTMLDTAAEDLDLNNILNWYVRDPVAMHNVNNPVKTHPMHFDKSLKHSELDEMNALITQLNPIARNLRSMGSLAADCVGAHVSLKWDNGNTHILSALMPHARDMQRAQREVKIWSVGKPTAHTIHILDPLYEPLQYPLYYIDGSVGWYCVNGTKPMSQSGHKLSQINYYKQLTLQDVVPLRNQDMEIGGKKYEPLRFGKLGDLMNEWGIDMFSRTEDEKLNGFYQSNQGKKKIAARRDLEGQGAKSGRVYLPKSHVGSTRHMRAEIADSWTLVTAFDKPTFFITMTFNTEWPEVLEHLLEGQKAKDRPDLCARIFKLKMQAVKEKIKQMWGEQMYSIGVIEYQKRGYPHCHFVLKMKFNEPKTAAEINHFVQAYAPPKHRPAYTWYKNMMQHNHTERCVQNAMPNHMYTGVVKNQMRIANTITHGQKTMKHMLQVKMGT